MTNPVMQIKQYDNLTDPSGYRNLETTGYVKTLDTSTSGHLDFGSLDITSSGVWAGTKMILFRPSSLGTVNEVFNFRFYLSSISAWGTGTYNFKWKKVIPFGASVALGAGDENIPTTLPTSGNVVSTASGAYIQSVAESGVSEYIYTDLFVGSDVQVGQYGGPGQGGFRYRLTYDFR